MDIETIGVDGCTTANKVIQDELALYWPGLKVLFSKIYSLFSSIIHLLVRLEETHGIN